MLVGLPTDKRTIYVSKRQHFGKHEIRVDVVRLQLHAVGCDRRHFLHQSRRNMSDRVATRKVRKIDPYGSGIEKAQPEKAIWKLLGESRRNDSKPIDNRLI